MQYISAYALASINGKQPTPETLKKILEATGKPVNEGEVKKIIDQFKGKNVDDLIKKGLSKVGSTGGSAPQKEEKKEQKKEAKKQEKKQEKKDDKKKKEKEPQPEPEDDMGPGDLFG